MGTSALIPKPPPGFDFDQPQAAGTRVPPPPGFDFDQPPPRAPRPGPRILAPEEVGMEIAPQTGELIPKKTRVDLGGGKFGESAPIISTRHSGLKPAQPHHVAAEQAQLEEAAKFGEQESAVGKMMSDAGAGATSPFGVPGAKPFKDFVEHVFGMQDEILRTSTNIARQAGIPAEKLTESAPVRFVIDAQRGVAEKAAGVAEFLTSPAGIGLVGAVGFAPAFVRSAINAGISADLALNMVRSWKTFGAEPSGKNFGAALGETMLLGVPTAAELARFPIKRSEAKAIFDFRERLLSAARGLRQRFAGAKTPEVLPPEATAPGQVPARVPPTIDAQTGPTEREISWRAMDAASVQPGRPMSAAEALAARTPEQVYRDLFDEAKAKTEEAAAARQRAEEYSLRRRLEPEQTLDEAGNVIPGHGMPDEAANPIIMPPLRPGLIPPGQPPTDLDPGEYAPGPIPGHGFPDMPPPPGFNFDAPPEAQGAIPAATAPRTAPQAPAAALAQPEPQPAPRETSAPADQGVVRMPTAEIIPDPVRLQYKRDAGEGGAGEELRGVTKFDRNAAGVGLVWRDPETGTTHPVNMHNRLALATRLGEPEMDVRYINAETADEARVIGALANIQEGRGTAVDAAKVFRDSGFTEQELAARGISLKGAIARDGLALSKLDPAIFDQVIQGDLPTARAVVIAGLTDHADQRALAEVIRAREKAGKRLTNEQIGEMIRLSPPKQTETQESLFGAEEASRSLIAEKAEISDYVRHRLGQEKRLFGTVGKEATAAQLGEAGNVIQAEGNRRIAEGAAQAAEVYDKLSTLAGPVSGTLDATAKLLAAGGNANAIKESAYKQVRAAVSQALGGPAGGRAGGVSADRKGRATPTPEATSVAEPPLRMAPRPLREARRIAPLMVGRGVEKPPESMAEAAAGARVKARPARGILKQPVVYINNAAAAMIEKAEERETGGGGIKGFQGVTLLPQHRVEIADNLRKEAERERNPAVRDKYLELATAIGSFPKAPTVALVQAGKASLPTDVKETLRHEGMHGEQVVTGRGQVDVLGERRNEFLEKPLTMIAMRNLIRKGAVGPLQSVAIAAEIPVYLGTGRAALLGLSHDEAIEVLVDYLELVTQIHGEGAWRIGDKMIPSIRRRVLGAYQGRKENMAVSLEGGPPQGERASGVRPAGTAELTPAVSGVPGRRPGEAGGGVQPAVSRAAVQEGLPETEGVAEHPLPEGYPAEARRVLGNKNEAHALYIAYREGRSIDDLSRIYGLSPANVRRVILRYGAEYAREAKRGLHQDEDARLRFRQRVGLPAGKIPPSVPDRPAGPRHAGQTIQDVADSISEELGGPQIVFGGDIAEPRASRRVESAPDPDSLAAVAERNAVTIQGLDVAKAKLREGERILRTKAWPAGVDRGAVQSNVGKLKALIQRVEKDPELRPLYAKGFFPSGSRLGKVERKIELSKERASARASKDYQERQAALLGPEETTAEARPAGIEKATGEALTKSIAMPGRGIGSVEGVGLFDAQQRLDLEAEPAPVKPAKPEQQPLFMRKQRDTIAEGAEYAARPGVFRAALDFMKPVETRLKQEGPAGKELAGKLRRAQDLGEVAAGKRVVELLDAGLMKLDRGERVELLDALEGRHDPATDPIQRAFDGVRGVTDRMAADATGAGVQVKVQVKLRPLDPIPPTAKLTGKQQDRRAAGKAVAVVYRRPFHGRANYFPHIIPSSEALRSGKIRADVIDNLVRQEITPNKESAAAFVDNYRQFIDTGGRVKALETFLINSGQARDEAEASRLLSFFRRRHIKRQGSLEYSRQVDLPFYDPDPLRVLPVFVHSASLRLAQIREFGQDNQVLNKLVHQVEQNPNAINVRAAVDRIIGISQELDTGTARVARFARMAQGFRLGLAFLPNATQGVLNTLLKSKDLGTVFAGARGLLSAEGRRFAMQSGASLEGVVSSMVRYAGGDSQALGKFLTATGFTGTEKANRIFAANAGAQYAGKMLNRLMAAPGDMRARHVLDELGLNPDALLRRGTLNGDDLLLAAKKFSDLTQFRADPIDLPLFASSELGKMMFQFKNYIYGQTRLVYDETVEEIRQGRPGSALKTLLVLAIAFPIAGELIDNLRKALTGRKPDKDAADRFEHEKRKALLDRYFRDIAQAGTLGMVSEALQSGGYRRAVEFAAGPTLSEIGQNVNVAFAPGEQRARNFGKLWFARIPLIGSLLANRVFPPIQPGGERGKAKREIMEALDRGQRATDQARKAVESGILSPADLRQIAKESALPPLERRFSAMALEQAAAAYRVANESEKARLRPILVEKLKAYAKRAPSLPADRRERVENELRKAVR